MSSQRFNQKVWQFSDASQFLARAGWVEVSEEEGEEGEEGGGEGGGEDRQGGGGSGYEVKGATD